jgi:hypothetical protein
MLQQIALLPVKNERQRSVNEFWDCIIENSEGFAVSSTHNRTINRHSRHNMVVTTSRLSPKHKRPRSVDDIWPWIMQNVRAAWWHWTIIKRSAAMLPGSGCYKIPNMSKKWASTERRRLLSLNLGNGMGFAVTLTHNRTIGRLFRHKCFWQDRNHVPQWVSTEWQWFLIMHLGQSNSNGMQITHNQLISCL